jgi:hypothetical protein
VRAGPPDLRGVQKDKAQRVQRDADGLSDVGHVRLSVMHVRTNAWRTPAAGLKAVAQVIEQGWLGPPRPSRKN